MAQKNLMIVYGHQLYKCQLHDSEPKHITIGREWTHHVTVLELEQTLTIEWDGIACYLHGKHILDEAKQYYVYQDKPICFYLINSTEKRMFDIAGIHQFSVGSSTYDDVELPTIQTEFTIIRNRDTNFHLEIVKGEVFHNYKKVESYAKLELGDHLFFEGIIMIVYKNEIQVVTSGRELLTKLIPLVNVDSRFSEEYPDYHRSPRIIYREPDEKRHIAKPSNKPSKPSEQLARNIIPPLVMIAALVIVSIIQPRGIFIIVMLSMTITTIIFSITTYIKSVKKYKAHMKQRDETYRAYIKRKRKELFKATEEQRHALHYHYPDIKEIREKILCVDARIYEKTRYHHDFLEFRTGLGNVDTSFDIDFKEEEFTEEEDVLIDMARDLYESYKTVEQVPVVTSLMKGPVGYIGQRALVLEQLQQVVMQLALFHSYHDVQFITIFPEEEKHKWDWMRWLPHASLQDLNVRGFVYHERSRDQVLNSMYQVLKDRKLTIDEQENKNQQVYFSPHFVILITDEKLILDHTIMEYFNEDSSSLGVSLVFVQDVMHSLPEHVTTVVDIKDKTTGNIILEEGELVNKRFIPDHFPVNFDKEDVSRGLAPLNHVQSLKNSIPESVTFLEMYGIEKVEELSLAQRWSQNETYKSMAVPLGLRGKDDIVALNLHEKAHGPHGLVAGTTGSGKSEIIQSYILSLAVNFHPHEVAFLLIDYKGGGMANLFKHLPHLLGTITNLDKAQSLRALASIKAELQKRQRLFGECDVNHINQYQKLYKEGKVEEPMPHLFLISDEFAELKAEQPDFMKELVSTARIGRSLGIHLILATQKPTGVVDDQIWSNSKFKLALKVQNESDSKEILKTPDAAEITLPGRAYLQVGNNEIYELFQSAWSGADYVSDKDDQEHIDTTIYAINDLGQYDILTEDLSGLDKKDEIKRVPTELDAVINHIHDYAETENIEALPRPWLPPLPERVIAEQIQLFNFVSDWKKEKQPLTVTVGLKDEPSLQAQGPLTLDLTKDGHIAVFSSPGYGKSTFLQTVLLNLARQHNPEQLHIYLLDFGTNGLLPLKGLPHVAETILLDEVEKLYKWIRLMTLTIQERKRNLSQFGVASMDMYEQLSGEIVPSIMVTLDNYDAVKDAGFAEEFNKIITQIAREGTSIGIHLAITASRQNAMRIPLLSNIKLQLALYLIDDSEIRSIVGKTELELEELNGRGIIKLEEPTLIQIALPAEGNDALEVIESMQSIIKQMDEYWDGERPEEIPMMPEGAIDFLKFKEKRSVKQIVKKENLPLGLEFEEVTSVSYNPAKHPYLLVISDRKEGLKQLTHGLAKNMSLLHDKYETMLLDTSDGELKKIGEQLTNYHADAVEIRTVKDSLISSINNRSKKNSGITKQLILIKDIKDFVSRSNITDNELSIFLEDAASVGIHFIFCGDYSYIGRNYDNAPKQIRRQATIGLMTMKLGDQDIFSQPFIRKEKYPSEFESYYVMDHEHVKIKIPE